MSDATALNIVVGRENEITERVHRSSFNTEGTCLHSRPMTILPDQSPAEARG